MGQNNDVMESKYDQNLLASTSKLNTTFSHSNQKFDFSFTSNGKFSKSLELNSQRKKASSEQCDSTFDVFEEEYFEADSITTVDDFCDHLNQTIDFINDLKNENEHQKQELAENAKLIAKMLIKKDEQAKHDEQELISKLLKERDDQAKVIEQLKMENAKINEQLNAALAKSNKLESIAKCGSSRLVDKLETRANDYFYNNLHEEAILINSEAIEVEELTQKRPMKLADLYAVKAQRLYLLAEYSDSIECASSALQNDPECLTSLETRGKSYFELKQYSEAQADFEKILQFDPKDVEASKFLIRIQSALVESI